MTGWPKLLLAANAALAIAIWLGRNEWSHPYLRKAGRVLSHLNPWHRTNQLLKLLLNEVKDANGRPLREALEHLTEGLDSVQATLAMIHVRQRMYDRMLENATITTDAAGRLTWASDGLLQLVGCTMDDVRGDNWINAIHQDDRKRVMEEWLNAVKYGRDFDMTYRYRATFDRPEITVQAHAYAAKAKLSAPPVGWVAIIRVIDAGAAKQEPLIEPGVRAASLRIDAERRCYRPAGEEGP
jgi:PAS domain S-box-containing protein